MPNMTHILDALGRHEKIGLGFSGGKDSLACVYLLREQLHRITIYHLDTGDSLPETRAVVAHVRDFAPHFIDLQGDVHTWIELNGLPSDLLPYTSHPIAAAVGAEGTRLVSRYDCCFKNLMWPCYSRMKADGNTLIIRGTKRADMKRLPIASGETDDGVEMLFPVQEWTDADVLGYLRQEGAPISRLYDHGITSPDCACCSAWWNEGRMRYLKEFHPALAQKYAARLDLVNRELTGPLASFQSELAA